MALINCPECGKEISEQATTCPNCGVAINPTPASPQNSNSSVKCPKCGSSNLQAISDTHGKGASFWKLCCCGYLDFAALEKPKQTITGFANLAEINLKCDGG